MDLNVKLILPKDRVVFPGPDERLYYLMGPIRGADDWQATAIRRLAELDPGCYVACPSRYTPDHPLYMYRQSGVPSFNRQTYWEREYMPLAAIHGCLIAWLAPESKTNPRAKKDGPYAQDTYGELGRYSVIVANDSRMKLCLGADDNFPGLDVIKCNMVEDFRRGAPTPRFRFAQCHTLESTLITAVDLAKGTDVYGMGFGMPLK